MSSARQQSRKHAAPSPPATFWTHAPWLVLLALLVVLAYGNSFGKALVYDNRALIAGDPRLHEVSWQNIEQVFSKNYWWPRLSVEYRPLTLLSYLFQYAVMGSGVDPAAYQAVNLALHWLNAALVYFLILALRATPVPAFFAAALFAVHPAATEAVANIVGRADLIGTASVLGGLLIYIGATRAPRPRAWRFAALGTVAAAGIFSKESAAVLPGVMLLYDLVWRMQPLHPKPPLNLVRNAWRWLRAGWYLPVLAPMAAFWAIRTSVFARLPVVIIPFVDNPLVQADFWTARFTAIKVLGRYLWLAVWPYRLSSDYSYNEIPLVDWHLRRWEDWAAAVSFAVLLLLGATALRCYRERKEICFFIGFFFIGLLPVANLVILIGTIMGERLLYLSLAGFAGAVVAVVLMLNARWWKHPVRAYVLLGAVLALAAVRTAARNDDWRGDQLFQRDLAAAPNSWRLHASAAAALTAAPGAGRIDTAVAEAEQAAAILKGLPPEESPYRFFGELGTYCYSKGDALGNASAAEAQGWYGKAERALTFAAQSMELQDRNLRRGELARGRRPDQIASTLDGNIYINLGYTHIRQGRLADAERALYRALSLTPWVPQVYENLAQVFFATNRPGYGLTALHEALLVEPDSARVQASLHKVYGQVDPQGCGATADLNAAPSNCAPVQEYRCQAYQALIKLCEGAHQPGPAGQFRRAAAQSRCPAR